MHPNFGQAPEYRRRTQLVSDGWGLIRVFGLLLPFSMLVIPLLVESEPSTFQRVIMYSSDDMKYNGLY